MTERKEKGSAAALLPIGVFLVLFLGSGFISGDFYAMPAVLAFLLALFVAFVQDRKHDFNEKIHIIAKGVGEDNIITMSLRRRIFRCGNSCRRGGQRGKFWTVHPAVPGGGCRTVRDRMLYFGFHGNVHGNDCGSCSDRGGYQRKDRI